MKNKTDALIKFVIVGGAVALLCGCNIIKYENGTTKVSCYRAFWNTDSYRVTMTNGVASMEVNKSGVDKEALNTALSAVVNAATSIK